MWAGRVSIVSGMKLRGNQQACERVAESVVADDDVGVKLKERVNAFHRID